jgi:hypothetical protein
VTVLVLRRICISMDVRVTPKSFQKWVFGETGLPLIALNIGNERFCVVRLTDSAALQETLLLRSLFVFAESHALAAATTVRKLADIVHACQTSMYLAPDKVALSLVHHVAVCAMGSDTAVKFKLNRSRGLSMWASQAHLADFSRDLAVSKTVSQEAAVDAFADRESMAETQLARAVHRHGISRSVDPLVAVRLSIELQDARNRVDTLITHRVDLSKACNQYQLRLWKKRCASEYARRSGQGGSVKESRPTPRCNTS